MSILSKQKLPLFVIQLYIVYWYVNRQTAFIILLNSWWLSIFSKQTPAIDTKRWLSILTPVWQVNKCEHISGDSKQARNLTCSINTSIYPSVLPSFLPIFVHRYIHAVVFSKHTYTNYLVNMRSKNAVEVEEQNICLRFLFSDIISFCSTIKNDKSELLVIIRSKELMRTHNHTFTFPLFRNSSGKKICYLAISYKYKKVTNSQLSHTGSKLITTIT